MTERELVLKFFKETGLKVATSEDINLYLADTHSPHRILGSNKEYNKTYKYIGNDEFYIKKTAEPTDISSPVTHPKHYNQGNIEVIDYVKSSMTPQEFKGFIKGNVIKYLAREEHKNGIEDMMKAKFYLDYYLKEFESPKIIMKGVENE